MRRVLGKPAAPIALIACAFIIAAAVFYMSRANVYEPKAELYVYGVGARFEYGADAKLRLTENGVVIAEKDGREYDPEHAPVFYRGEDRAILTAPMLAVSDDGRQGRVERLSEISLSDGGALVKTGREEIPLEGGFLFDGGDIYIFLEGAYIVIGDSSYRITPMTYAVAVRGARVEIYPRGAEKGLMLDANGAELTALMDGGCSVDMGKDILRGDGAETLLFTDPSMLAPLE
jgi:hypothetical protein